MLEHRHIPALSDLPEEWRNAWCSARRVWPTGVAIRRALLSGRCLGALWRLLLDIVRVSPAVEFSSKDGARRFRACEARFWEILSVARFDHQIFPKSNPLWETALYLLKMKLGSGATLFLVRDCASPQRIIATIYLRRLPALAVGFISNVGVHPDYRRQGLAERLIRNVALPEARRLGLQRLILNAEADSFVQAFYLRLGFRNAWRHDFEIDTPTRECPMEMEIQSTA